MRILYVCALFILLSGVVKSQNEQTTEDLIARPPGNCEGNSLRLDILRSKIAESRILNVDLIVIAIAHLGRGESNLQTNKRRLYTITKYLNLPKNIIVPASGERVEGFGRVNIYLYGTLIESFAAEKRRDLPVGTCDNDVLDFKNYQLPRQTKKIKLPSKK